MFQSTAATARKTHVGTDTFVRPAGQRPAARSALRVIVSAYFALLVPLFVTSSLRAADCIPIHEANQHVGETKCVSGKVLRIKIGSKGVHFLDFCEDQMACPFTVVVFPSGLKDVGDVRRLAGRTIEIHGAVKLYDGRAEMILNRIGQITGGAAMIPPLPKDYDVEKRGHYSAGHLRPTKKPIKTKTSPNPTATYGKDGDVEEPQ